MEQDLVTEQDFFKDYREIFQQIVTECTKELELISEKEHDIIEHIYCRIKSTDSTKCKLEKLGFEVTPKSSITNIQDVIGIRVIMRFVDDIFILLDALKQHKYFQIITIKDYITNAKPNGYRSLHVICNVSIDGDLYPIEIQVRTISQDSWASLEHKLKYKKEIANKNVIVQELKRCADELASIDISMQTIKDLIEETNT